MSEAMHGLVVELLGSKKFTALVLGLVASFLAWAGLPADLAEPLTEVVTKLVGAYLVGQGVADFGKGRAKAEAQAGRVVVGSAGSEAPPAE